MRLVDLQMSVPGLVLVIFLAFMIGPASGRRLLSSASSAGSRTRALFAARCSSWPSSSTSSLRGPFGASPGRVIFRHALPSAVPSFVVLSTLQFGVAIVVEASVSFLGFGIQPPGEFARFPHFGWACAHDNDALDALSPAAVLFLLVLLVNFIGDELNEWLDPVRRRA